MKYDQNKKIKVEMKLMYRLFPIIFIFVMIDIFATRFNKTKLFIYK